MTARAGRKTTKKTTIARKKTPSKTPLVRSAPQGGLLRSGNPGNAGGKPGRSGRRPDAFREELAAVRDEKGLPVLLQVLDGEVRYTLIGKCEHCGKESSGDAAKLLKLIPSPDTRLRAFELTAKHTLPEEKVIRLEGVEGVQAIFDVIRARIRTKLGPEAGCQLIEDIHQSLKSGT